MNFVSFFIENATRAEGKVALITERNQLTFRDILWMMHYIQNALGKSGATEGTTIVCDIRSTETVLLFELLSFFYGYHVIQADIESVNSAEVPYDLFVGPRPVPEVPIQKMFLIDPKWFADIPNDHLPAFPEIDNEVGSSTTLSSGSTGVPKFVRSLYARRMLSFIGKVERGRTNPDERHMCTLSPYASWSINVYLAAMATGGSVVALEEHRARLAQYIDLYRVTHLVATPIILRNLINWPTTSSMLGSVREVLVGGAYANPDLLSQFAETYNIPIAVGYGTSEIGGLSVYSFSEISKFDQGYVGDISRSDLEIAFFNDEMNKISGASEGVVGIRSSVDGILPQYLGKDGDFAEQESISNGYFFPGDRMRLDGASLYVTGRVKNVLNVSGNKIALHIIEATLNEDYPEVQFGCVAIEGDFDFDHLLVYCESRWDFSIDDINQTLAKKFNTVRAFELIKKNVLPQTPTGKVDVQALKSEYLAS